MIAGDNRDTARAVGGGGAGRAGVAGAGVCVRVCACERNTAAAPALSVFVKLRRSIVMGASGARARAMTGIIDYRCERTLSHQVTQRRRREATPPRDRAR